MSPELKDMLLMLGSAKKPFKKLKPMPKKQKQLVQGERGTDPPPRASEAF